jgi:hypothetical protein
MPLLIQSMRIVGTPWCRRNQSETATWGHKFNWDHSLTILKVDEYKWILTSQLKPTRTNQLELQGTCCCSFKNVLADWATFSGTNCPPALQPLSQLVSAALRGPCSAQTAAQHFDLLFERIPCAAQHIPRRKQMDPITTWRDHVFNLLIIFATW